MNEERLSLPSRHAINFVDGKIRFIDQRYLPHKLKIVETDDWRVIAKAINNLSLRGAPLIGVAAALAVAATALKNRNKSTLRKTINAIDGLFSTRPTAQNLFWALERMRDVAIRTAREEELTTKLVDEAMEILEDDRNRCRLIGNNGARLIDNVTNVLTICNTGFLATGGEGTALAVIYRAQDEGKKVHVYACETRPLLQGARLTAWELQNAGIPFTLIVDSAAAGLIASSKVDVCIIGADRIAVNGDTANKIGSYQLALACQVHGVDFYVAAPESTIDTGCLRGEEIPLEERSPEEVLICGSKRIALAGVSAVNPAFDLVPAQCITGIITEKKVYKPPYNFRK